MPPSPPPLRPFRLDTTFSVILAILVAVGLGLSVIAAQRQEQRNVLQVQNNLSGIFDAAQKTVLERFEVYQNGLRDLRAATTAITDLTETKFNTLVTLMDTDGRFPGAYGFGLVVPIREGAEADFLRGVSAEGDANFRINRFENHEGDRYIIRFFTRTSDVSWSTKGWDLASEKERRLTALRAARDGSPALSGPLAFATDAGTSRKSFMLFTPLYTGDKTPATEEERLASLRGWIYTPLVLNTVIGSETFDGNFIHLTIKDADAQENAAEFYNTAGGSPGESKLFTQRREIDVLGRHWLMALSAHPAYIKSLRQLQPSSVLYLGVVLTLLSASLLGSIGYALRRGLDSKLAENQRYTADLLANIRAGVLQTDETGKTVYTNPRALEILGLAEDEILGKALLHIDVDFLRDDGTLFSEESLAAIRGTITGKPMHGLPLGIRKRTQTEVRWLLVDFEPRLVAKGKVSRVDISFIDVTEQIRGRQALANALADLKKTHDILERTEKTARIGGFITDFDTGATLWTSGAYALHDLDPADQAGFKTYLDTIRARRGPEFARAIEDWNKNGGIFTEEQESYTATGKRIWLRVYAEHILENGKPVGGVGFMQDITAQKDAALEAQRALEELERTERIARVGGWAYDVNTRAMTWTASSHRILDLDPADKAGITAYFERFLADPIADAFNAAFAAIANGTDYDFDFPATTASGRRIWVQTHGEPIWRDGKVVSLVGHLQDITAQKEAAQAAARALEDLERTEKIAKVGGWSHDLKTNKITWTAGCRHIYDLDPNDLAGMDEYYDLYRNATMLESEEKIQKAITDGTSYDFDLKAPTALGREIWVHVHGTPVYQGQEVVKLVGHLQDVTWQKEFELKLANANAQLQATLDATVEGIAAIDAQGSIVRVNRAVSIIFGYAAEELMGNDISLLLPNPDRELHQVKERNGPIKSLTKAIGSSREVTGRRKNGEEFWLELTVAKLEFGHNETHYICALRDVSKRKETEAHLRAAQKMEAVGQLTAGIAHDFNNLLAVVMSNLELLQEEAGITPFMTKRIASALQATERGADLTQHLLAFGRNQALSPRQADLRQNIARNAQLLKRTLPGTIKLIVDAADTPVWAKVDEAQLENALLNLSLNARDAMPEGGTLTFTVNYQTLTAGKAAHRDALPPGEYAVISISDTGCGMSEDVKEKVFDPFFTTKPVGHGSGLGLSMVYGFVRQSGGDVLLDSMPSRGSTFTLFFPSLTGDSQAPMESISAPELITTTLRRVLLVEDMSDVRSAITEQLISLGHSVSAAYDGPSALKLLDEQGPFDLMITDLGLPGAINGDKLADEVARRQPSIKIITMTGYNRDRAQSEGNTQGLGRVHLRKPFKRNDLQKAMSDLLASA